jgi:peptide/nickel transport system permease protein
MIAIGIFNIPIFARVTRATSLSLWERDFVTSARAIGRSDSSIIWKYILPNILSTLIVQGTVQFAIAILAEAGLSYLGLGTQPPHASWGRMLNEAQTFMATSAWLAIFPGCAIALSVLGLNLLGDGLRDILDPNSRVELDYNKNDKEFRTPNSKLKTATEELLKLDRLLKETKETNSSS